MAKRRRRPYRSLVRERQADDTRHRVIQAARALLQRDGYAGMTVDAVARKAEVAPQTIYAIFKSKTGIIAGILHAASFGPTYDSLVQQAMSSADGEERLRMAAKIARQIHEAQSATFDLFRGAGVLAPELATLEQSREGIRYERQEPTIRLLSDSGALPRGVSYATARDIFWMYTGREIYRMLVFERGWTPEDYEQWLADTLVRSLLEQKGAKTQRVSSSRRYGRGTR